jgi:hypothetical protein
MADQLDLLSLVLNSMIGYDVDIQNSDNTLRPVQ